MEQFVRKLKQQVANCGFGDTCDKQIRDHAIVVCKSSQAQTKGERHDIGGLSQNCDNVYALAVKREAKQRDNMVDIQVGGITNQSTDRFRLYGKCCVL